MQSLTTILSNNALRSWGNAHNGILSENKQTRYKTAYPALNIYLTSVYHPIYLSLYLYLSSVFNTGDHYLLYNCLYFPKFRMNAEQHDFLSSEKLSLYIFLCLSLW